jgi:FixJ family two-component response regulator
MPTVFLVDDDSSVRKALTRLIRAAGYESRAFSSAREFIESKPETAGIACLVLDVRMPDLNGLDLQQALHAANISLPIVFITGHGDIPMSVKAMKAGAVDFLPKPVHEKTLLPAIEQALARSSRQQTAAAELQGIRRRVNALTRREREVMEQVVSGMLNKQIAHKLGTVEKTVKVHRARVMDKMGVHSVAELVRMAEKVGIPGKN